MADELGFKTEKELIQARQAREDALTAEKPDKAKIAEANARFAKAQKDRLEYLEEQAKAVSAKAKVAEMNSRHIRDIRRRRYSVATYRQTPVLNHYIRAAVARRPLDGFEAELNQELGMPIDMTDRGLAIPADLVMNFAENGDVELNADANTLVTNVTNAQPLNQGPITPLVYARNLADFLGVDKPMVAPGKQSYPFLSSGASASYVGEGSSVDSVAAAISKVEVTPTRLQASFTVSTDSILDVGPELESILQDDLRMELDDEMDKAIINGSGTAPAPKGIMTQLGAAVQADGDTGATADDAEYDWEDYMRVAYAHLDDRIYTEPTMLRLAIGKDTLTHAAGKYNSNNNPTSQGVQAMRSEGMVVRYSGRIADAAAADGSVGELQSAILVSTPYARNCVVPIWQDMYLIVDNLTQHRAGIAIFTLVMYHGIGYRRSGATGIEGWKKLAFTLSDKI